jgi:S-adenosylmethionine:tRNA ribosyltransferase-isomerase
MIDLDQIAAYDFELPQELIAQRPVTPRDSCRLMVVDRATGAIEHHRFSDLRQLLEPGDRLVLNNSRVLAARLRGRRPSGGQVQLLLVRPLSEPGVWEAIGRPGRRLGPGAQILIGEASLCVVNRRPDGRLEIRHEGGDMLELLSSAGSMPIPPYIRSGRADATDLVDYQTVYAQRPGSIAAPTAGLHFTPELLADLKQKGVEVATIELQVGPGTFAPVRSETLSGHLLEPERYAISSQVADQLNRPGGRRIGVGTTCCRTLESAVGQDGRIQSGEGDASLLIRPGHAFRAVDSLITNFHLPRTTLLALVSALAGYELIQEAYQEAIRQRYRFFSYGDAMWIR